MPQTFFVTGASGTVGSAVVARFLRNGAHVRALLRSPEGPAGVERIAGDLDDAKALREGMEGAEAVIHCAAVLDDDPEICRRINVEGTEHVVRAAVAAKVKLVHLSSVSVYDKKGGPSFEEDSPIQTRPVQDYGSSKAEAERRVLAGVQHGLVAVILRPVMVHSMHPRSYWGPLAIERARTEQGRVLGFASMPYVHADNLAEAVERAVTTTVPSGRAFNVIDGQIPAERYLAALARALGRSAPFVAAPARAIRFSGERIRSELVYEPVNHLDTFLRELSEARR